MPLWRGSLDIIVRRVSSHELSIYMPRKMGLLWRNGSPGREAGAFFVVDAACDALIVTYCIKCSEKYDLDHIQGFTGVL